MKMPPVDWILRPVSRPAPEMAMKASQGAIRLLVQRSKRRAAQEASFEERRSEWRPARLRR